MTDAELSALEAAAKAASRGPWHTSISDSCYVIDAGDYIVCATSGICGADTDAAYIAAANPAAVLELIAELRQARAERDWVIEQIFTGWPCPPLSDETIEDCDKKISCEDCWLQAAKEAVCQK